MARALKTKEVTVRGRKTSQGDKVANERICSTNSHNHPQSRSIVRDNATSPQDDYSIERSRQHLVLLNSETDYDVKKDFRTLL